MTIKHFIKGMILFIPLLLLSCNEEQTITESKCKIICSVDEFESTDLSRTTTDPNNNFLITWASGDIIGIFPREGYQEPFEIPTNQIGNTSASFDGGYWDVKDGLQYNAYYPFDKKNFDTADMKTKIPVSYIGQKQNGTSCNIGAFDYTYSDWKTASGGIVSFDFHHIGAIAVFSLKYPATTTYTKLTLSADDAVIPLEGTYDLTAEDVSFIADENSYSNSISLELNNCSGVAGETGVFYMMLPPMDLTNNEVTFTLTTSEGTVCSYSIEKALNVKKGKLYRRTGIPTESNVEGTIDGWIEERSCYSDGIAFVAKAGELSSIIPSNEKYTITSLKISGVLNGTDVKFIREMAGIAYRSDDAIVKTQGKLVELDIQNVNIVKGGDSYRKDYTTDECFDLNSNTGKFKIPKEMFAYCNLEKIVLPSNLTEIGHTAFLSCSSLVSLTIPQNVKKIENQAFFSCEGLSSITLPEELISIGDTAFAFCNSLIDISIPESVTYLGLLYHMPITTLHLPDNLEYLGGFTNCTKLTSIEIPQKVTSIGDYGFAFCSSLTSIVEIPEGITTIGEYMFQSCNKLTEVHLPKSISYIEKGAFDLYPSSSFKLYCYAEECPKIENSSSFNTLQLSKKAILYVPKGCKTKYQNSDWGSYFSTIVEMN